MPRMPETVAALQRGETIRVARLVQLDFASETFRLHQGFGPIATRDPDNPSALVTWDGIGQAGEISDIDRAVVPSNGTVATLTLSGVDLGLVDKALAASAEIKGRPARIFEQYYGEDWSRLDAPFGICTGLMDRMPISDDGTTAKITLTLITLLFRRRRPAFGYLSAVSQRRLHPGDAGGDHIFELQQQTAKWPLY